MDKIVPFPDADPDEALEAEACEWFARLDNGNLSAEEMAAFREWATRSPQHRAEFERIAGVWGQLDVLNELTADHAKHPKRVGRPRWMQFWSTPRLAMAATSVLVLVVAAAALLRLSDSALEEPGGRYVTALGEQRSVALADGSTALLNTDSRIEVSYDDTRRAVRLLQGEVHFTVAHDPDRSFLVYAGTGMMRAVGTAFTVRVREADVEVTVTEGTIELAATPDTVSRDPQNPSDVQEPRESGVLAVVEAQHQATFNHGIESIQPIEPEALARKLSWHEGMLSFSGDPLEEVVKEVSRYTPIRIVIVDPALRDLRVGGYFRIGETDDIFEALETTFNVRVQRVNDELVYLASGSG